VNAKAAEAQPQNLLGTYNIHPKVLPAFVLFCAKYFNRSNSRHHKLRSNYITPIKFWKMGSNPSLIDIRVIQCYSTTDTLCLFYSFQRIILHAR